ncbi:uncharacterized protein MELLADRAFT_87069 [Melampsora larici-populina 98AG31]|uniref:Uncharacterized protein n=1 Tax=Melampsora larici-populina (strain 98AG31 / pathotype 3-4-7) TaxID=747676 RepID=F4R4E7_MELLP|nr:uncharacterized protein MELLADRAFT_87069 [Melampsora larici-populina 98AG31]EGG12798.1 hypothetical protein MELLADRAFT_87069 [Melampsora larici-populina 98AG31]
MLSFEQTLQKITTLCNQCPSLREGTREDLTFKTFSNAPVTNAEEGMWYSVNLTLDSVFGRDCIKKNISKGTFGLPLVVEWVRKAQKHQTWDGDCDKLIRVKLDNIISALKDAGAEDNESEEPSVSKSVGGTKRRIVSNPKTSKTPKPPAKQPKTTSTNDSNTIVLSSDDEVVITKVTIRGTTKKAQKQVKKTNVEERPGGKEFSCHCGAKPIWLDSGRVRSAEAHWASATCKDKTCGLTKTTQLTSYFQSSTALNPNLIEVTCPGLNDNTWKRDRATQSITSFISKTPSIYRGNYQHEICRSLFGSQAQESKLSKEQKAELIATLDARSIWQVKRQGERSAIHSSNCTKTFLRRKRNNKKLISDACEEVKENRSLLRAINTKFADDKTFKYSRNTYHEDNNNCFSPTLLKLSNCRLLCTSIDTAANGDFGNFMTVVAASSRNGLFDNRDATRGLIKAVAIKAARENTGKTTRGMKIDLCLDEFVITLGAISPRALSLFNDNFAGRSNRSLRMIRAKEGMHLLDGLHIANFNRISQVLKDLGYSGPVAAASDQTVCVKRLCHDNGCLVGAQGGDIPFKDASELPDLVKSVVKKKDLCSKCIPFEQIRAYTLQVPLPNVPTFVVALIASCDKETSNDILDNHIKFLNLAEESGINILLLGADGAPTELCAQSALAETATQFISYSNSTYNVHIKVSLMGHPPRPIVMVQDPKHARKTGANQLGSGARLIIIGKYHVSIQQTYLTATNRTMGEHFAL